MPQMKPCSPNPMRVAAGRRNRAKRKELTEEGRQRLRASALRHQPWRHATGPKTPEGKAQAARNGKVRQKGLKSVREIRANLAPLRDLLRVMRAASAAVVGR